MRMELLKQLRGTGFEIQLMEEGCECFAVVDQKIVWYGNMNFLSKEDMEDNLMRVVSGDIAAEIMEMTFGGERELWVANITGTYYNRGKEKGICHYGESF